MSHLFGTQYFLRYFLPILLFGVVASKDCAIDSSEGLLDPDNVYPCPDDQTCCIQENKPSCCSNPPIENEVSDQGKIWGILIGGAVFVAIMVFCCRRDSDEGGKTCKYYVTCGCCCSKKHDEDVEYQKFPPPSPTASVNSTMVHDSTKPLVAPPKPGNIEQIAEKKMAAPSADAIKSKTEFQEIQAEKLIQKLN